MPEGETLDLAASIPTPVSAGPTYPGASLDTSFWVDLEPTLSDPFLLLCLAAWATVLACLLIGVIRAFRFRRPVLGAALIVGFGLAVWHTRYCEMEFMTLLITRLSPNIGSVGYFGWPGGWISRILGVVAGLVYWLLTRKKAPGQSPGPS